jgi:outer membrane protein OmpA-like peptidoglycan-associated protein
MAFAALAAACATAQVTPEKARQANPTQQPSTQVERLAETPVFRVTVVSRTAKAINYRHRAGATKVDFRGTAIMPSARGEAKVESKKGYIEIEVEFDDISGPASQFGREYLTYVMWAITPEGRATNLGELILSDGDKGKLNVTTELQNFGLVVTAEPYYAVSQPSDVVVMENTVRADTVGKVDVIDAKYELLQRGQYILRADEYRPVPRAPGVPNELVQARNAVQIARLAGADKYAADSFNKAVRSLEQSESYQQRKQGRPAVMMAREAVQTAEDARLIALKRIEEERLAKERQAAADREAAARAAAAQAEAEQRAEAQRRAQAEAEQRAEAERRAQAEAARLAADRARSEAERMKAEAEAAAARAAAEREAAEKARAAALAQQQALQVEADRARQAADEANRLRQQAEQERAELRQRLLQQFNMILETRDSARGLIVNMSDVLFDFNKATLRPGAREKLAKISGIVLAHPGLKLEVEGHTDSVGTDEYNQKLSEQRAASVRDYLVQQGVSTANIAARGFGEAKPVASNDNAAGRQQNRRVELVVSGEIIGSEIGSASRSTP